MSDTLLLRNQTHALEFPTIGGIRQARPACPLTGSHHIQVLEEIPTSLLVNCFQRDLAINVAPEYQGVERVQLCRCPESQVIFFFPFISGSPKFYKQLQTFDWYYQASKFEYQHAAVWIKTGDRVLDIGCGAAHLVNYIPNASYLGLDPHCSPRANPLPWETRILAENVTRHAISHSQTYDVVCAFQVMEHMENPRTFLTAALSCLKPDGLLILGVPSADSYITKIPNFVLNAPPHHITWWTNEALCHLADQFQLSIMDLVRAPVESWETRLYWMQRILEVLPQLGFSYFTESTGRQFLNMAAYMFAGFLQKYAKPPVEARGSTVVMVGKKGQSPTSISLPTQTFTQPIHHET